MTQLVGGSPEPFPQTPRPSSQRKILVTRTWSTQGVDPYDEVTWERRDVVLTDWRTGAVVFEQRGVEFPTSWSINASNIVTTKYFRGAVGAFDREWSLRQLIDRVVGKYWTTGLDDDYFETPGDSITFREELKSMLLHQVFSFNSPVWFNVGTTSKQQCSACFILSVEDSMESILDWYKEEGLIFKGGSGSGVNLSRIRGSMELLSSGGTASGPVSFMRGADASAGTIKSGGACLAPWALVYTAEHGPVPVKDLAAQGLDFHTVSYNPLLGRMQATTARAFESGYKQLVRLVTDKGSFTMSADHPVMLMSGGYRAAGSLLPGMSLRPANITVNKFGYQRVGLQDGTKRKESIHRLIACDVLGFSVTGNEVHHRDRFHGKGNHPAIAGSANGMSFVSGNRTEEYRRQQVAGMRRSGVYQLGQGAAARQRMLNKAYEIVNAGGSIDTFSSYFTGRVALAGKLGYSRAQQLAKIEERFGSYEEFLNEVQTNNHCVVAVEFLEMSPVFDIEVDSATPNDRSNADGHNFMIVSEINAQKGYTGIMVHNTRRAAKMVILNVDHPDIEEFIGLKAREEKKIRVLRDAGFDMEVGGRDTTSVQYQNANNSVRVTDKFMHAAMHNLPFDLVARSDNRAVKTVNAKELFHQIAQAAWECADPGLQYDDTINDWHTNPESGRIDGSNPCSEYMSLNNSSCNLASLNLMKFRTDTGDFDVHRFIKAVEIVITAMDISIVFGEFPTQKIAEVTKAYRQLGLGYANLGALLMSLGLPYDSDEGRNVAAAITSLMTAVAYRRSAEMAGAVGPYAGFMRNRDSHVQVMSKHSNAHLDIADTIYFTEDIITAATQEWHECLNLGSKFGYRNAQASLLAPTGTIGFMMDVDTTGIEPDLALVKLKKLVGGSSMQIVNQTIPVALETLGYQQERVEAIINHIMEHGHVVGAPGLQQNHYPVFDCAMGERTIAPMGHVLMMAAVQPFLSGAISKTVNMPESATVEEIEDIYLQGWRLGLKAMAVYRDNCKVGQVLNVGGSKKVAEEQQSTAPEPVRRRLPKRRPSQTSSFAVGGAEGYLTTSSYPDNGELGEVFLKMSKQGSTLAGIMDAFSVALSIGLQYGVPLETFVSKFRDMRFEPGGITDDPEIRIATSLVDYIFRRLAIDFIPYERRLELGLLTTAERTVQVDAGDTGHEQEPLPGAVVSESKLCFTCGSGMRQAGSCFVCETCGTTSGCS